MTARRVPMRRSMIYKRRGCRVIDKVLIVSVGEIAMPPSLIGSEVTGMPVTPESIKMALAAAPAWKTFLRVGTGGGTPVAHPDSSSARLCHPPLRMDSRHESVAL